MTVTRAVFFDNHGSNQGGGAYAYRTSFRGCVFVDNDAPSYPGIGGYGYQGESGFNLFWDGVAPDRENRGESAGIDPLYSDPLLVDPASGDFRPRPGSPLIDTGPPDLEPDTLQTRADTTFFAPRTIHLAPRETVRTERSFATPVIGDVYPFHLSSWCSSLPWETWATARKDLQVWGGQTFRVPEDYDRISDALANAIPGDRVEVSPGVYDEALSMSTEGVTLAGAGIYLTELRPSAYGSAITVSPLLSPPPIVRDLTIRGTSGARHGAGVFLDCQSSVVLDHVRFARCNAAELGGAIYQGQSSTLEMRSCGVDTCQAQWGGGISSYGLVTAAGFTASDNTSSTNGGALTLGGSAVLDSCEIVGNAAQTGGGIWAQALEGKLRISASTFEENDALWGGGGLYVGRPGWDDEPEDTLLVDCTFKENVAEWGAGVFVRNGAWSMHGSRWFANEATEGGGIYLERTGERLTVSECIFQENDAIRGGGLYTLDARGKVTDCDFEWNTAWDGAAVRVTGQGAAPFQLFRSTFSENHARDVGAGISGRLAGPEIVACDFLANTAENAGAGAHIREGDAHIASNVFWAGEALFGGGVVLTRGGASGLFHNLFVENAGTGWGGGILLRRGVAPAISGNIMAWNGSGAGLHVEDEESTSTATYNLYWANQGGSYGGYALPGIGDLETDPLFVDRQLGDFHVTGGSPAVDAGDPDTYDACLPPGLGTERADIGAYGGPDNCWRAD